MKQPVPIRNVALAKTRSLVDVALIGAGLASAAASVVFAATMLARGDHAPMVNGMQYLAIFGQTQRTHTSPAAPPAPAQVAARADADKAIDFAPTGSIPRAVAAETAQADPYRLIAVEPGMAWLRNSAEMRIVKPGDIAPGLGRVGAIVNREGRWMLVDDSGAVLLAADPPQKAATALDPFSRRMIFGAGD
jgi:hypothetical protein